MTMEWQNQPEWAELTREHESPLTWGRIFLLCGVGGLLWAIGIELFCQIWR